jgi:hypothetical protein
VRAEDAGGGTDDGGSDAQGSGAHGIAFVQAMSAQSANQPGVEVTLLAPTEAHALLVVAVSLDTTGTAGGLPPTVNDDQGDTFQSRVDVVSGTWGHFIFAAEDAAAGVQHLSVLTKDNIPMPTMLAYAHEYSGVARNGGFVTSQPRASPCSVPGTDCMTTAAMDAPARSLLFGYVFNFNQLVEAGSGFTQRATRNDNITEDRVVDVPLAYPVTATMVALGAGSAILGAVFQP